MKPLLTTAAALLLTVSTACMAAPPKAAAVKAETTSMQGTCNPEGAKPLVGSKAEGGNVQQARVLAGADSFRILRPGDTGESFAPDPGRLNIHVDADTVINNFTCG